MGSGRQTYRIYGVTVTIAPQIVPMLTPAEWHGPIDLSFECVSAEPGIDLGPGKVVFDKGPIRITRHPDGHTLFFSDSTVHYVLDDRIICHLKRDEHLFLVPIQLLGMVMATWLEARGGMALHASAVAFAGGARVFLAGGKAGKTSLATEFVSAGALFVSEDLVHVSSIAGTFQVAPAYPMLRMWPETAAHFLGSAEGLSLYHPDYAKVWVGVDRVGSFTSQSWPMHCIYVPQRGESGEVRLDQLDHLAAMKAVMGGSFLADMMEPAPDPAARLGSVSELVASVPVKQLVYPDGLEHLHLVRSAVERDSIAGA